MDFFTVRENGAAVARHQIHVPRLAQPAPHAPLPAHPAVPAAALHPVPGNGAADHAQGSSYRRF
jgi:hypothetical protein